MSGRRSVKLGIEYSSNRKMISDRPDRGFNFCRRPENNFPTDFHREMPSVVPSSKLSIR